jgi:hypothetical protein
MKTGSKRLIAGVVSVLVLALGIYFAATLRETRRDVRRTLCVHNLKMLAIGLKEYAEDNEEQFPDRLSELYPEYIVTLEVFVCPELGLQHKKQRGVPHPFDANPSPEAIDSLGSYILVPGLTTGDSADTVIVYEKADHHLGMGRSLLYLDGRGAWEPPENWRNGPPNANLPEGF